MTGRTTTNLYLDGIIFITFLVAMEPDLTGLPVHEWLGLALGVGLLAHLLMHWKWVVGVVKRFFRPLPWRVRLNFILNTALLTAFTLILVSGIMISESLGVAQLLRLENGSPAWRGIHHTASNLSLLLVGLHVALHWGWITNTFKRYVLRRQPQSARRPQAKRLSRA